MQWPINVVECCVDNISVRALTPKDCDDLIAIRLESLEKHPNYFCATLVETKKLTKENWIERINNATSKTFGLFDGESLIGITGIYTPEDEPNTAVLVMSYIKPEYRGRGYSALFYEERINWALTQNHLETIKVSHREGNKPSRAAIIKHGFKFTETRDIDWPDGTRDIEYIYQLDLSILRNPHRTV